MVVNRYLPYFKIITMKDSQSLKPRFGGFTLLLCRVNLVPRVYFPGNEVDAEYGNKMRAARAARFFFLF